MQKVHKVHDVHCMLTCPSVCQTEAACGLFEVHTGSMTQVPEEMLPLTAYMNLHGLLDCLVLSCPVPDKPIMARNYI